MGTHPIFESDFDCLTVQSKWKIAAQCGAYLALGLILAVVRNRSATFGQTKKRMASLDKFYEPPIGDHQIKKTFITLSKDEATEDFIKWSKERTEQFFLQLFYDVTAPFMKIFTTKTTTNAILGRGEMFVVSKEQLMKMLPDVYAENPDHKFKNWIDLGAGDGGALIRGPSLMTEKMSTTEICPVMRKRLEWRGFTVEDTDNWDQTETKWDVISMLNLLDRAAYPDMFLDKAYDALAPDGILIIAIVLPYRPYVERGGTIANKPYADVHKFISPSRKYVDQVDRFIKAVEKKGFKHTTWSSVPYLCEGDRTIGYYSLKDTIIVFRKDSTISSVSQSNQPSTEQKKDEL